MFEWIDIKDASKVPNYHKSSIRSCSPSGHALPIECDISRDTVVRACDPLKEVLLDGIAVISTDFENPGRQAAAMVLRKGECSFANPFYVIARNSLQPPGMVLAATRRRQPTTR